MHPSNDPSRNQFLFRDLADQLTKIGVAVLRYDRPEDDLNRDVPFRIQLADARHAIRWCRDQIGPLPIGYDTDDCGQLDRLRDAYECFERGQISRERAQQQINEAATRPWFDLAWVPRTLPQRPSWIDMDFDPSPEVAKISCPILVFYGDDAWIPVTDSIALWRQHVARSQQLSVERLPGTSHYPTVNSGRTIESISPRYRRMLSDWIREQVRHQNSTEHDA